MDYGTACWHCIVTAFTIGYGDVDIATPTGQIWASIHILLSVSLLGDAITTFDNLSQQRREDLKYMEALHRQLDQRLIETLEMRAAELRPHVSRDAEGLTELEFVICMAVELGMVPMKSLQPFLAQFRALDVTNNGRVGMEDVSAALQVQQELSRRKKKVVQALSGSLLRPTRTLSAAGARWVSAGAQVQARRPSTSSGSAERSGVRPVVKLRNVITMSRLAVASSALNSSNGRPDEQSNQVPPRLFRSKSVRRWQRAGFVTRVATKRSWNLKPGQEFVVVGGSALLDAPSSTSNATATQVKVVEQGARKRVGGIDE